MQRAPFSCLLFVGMLVTSAHAQRDTTARLAGTVRSSINGLPISGVMVAVKGSRVFGVSDSTGSFALGGLPEGRQVVRI
ncbi:MAG TPA: carboxypeptidase regulatory-like domain-containing protein, partial [Gemmatimonadales bacterium]|nr:carboxypeptidase regulatory-like domain-containing protein [Gemmatimonadales bacterium]